MMSVRLSSGLAALAFLAAGFPSGLRAEGAGGLQPFQMVRSLELVQDRIAAGDHAALPMQRKLLEMADARFRSMTEAEFEEPLNLRALLVYAMSGGNPATVEAALARLGKDDPDRGLGEGILFYLQGQPKAAQRVLAAVDPMTYTPELGAYLALVRGSVLSNDDPKAAIMLLDQARLIGPGTLVEEAALRRTIALSATLGDPERFMLASTQYVRSYLKSPYASQFADAFVAGVIALQAHIDLAEVGEVVAMMDAEREKVVYLRIARRAAIDGLTELSAFASARADGTDDDPRALLYASLSKVTSGSVEEVLATLATIDRTRLSENDRRLLDAAKVVASEMTAAPARVSGKDLMPAPIEAAAAVSAAASVADQNGPQPLAPAAHEMAAAVPEAAGDTAVAPEKGVEAPADAAETMMQETRRKLDDIDKMLGETAE